MLPTAAFISPTTVAVECAAGPFDDAEDALALGLVLASEVARPLKFTPAARSAAGNRACIAVNNFVSLVFDAVSSWFGEVAVGAAALPATSLTPLLLLLLLPEGVLVGCDVVVNDADADTDAVDAFAVELAFDEDAMDAEALLVFCGA